METRISEAYEKTGEEFIAELNAQAVLYRHKKTGAKIFTLSCSDDNKVFMVAFRTPVSDSTGVPHIMEHSVLCGSRKYPVKDPFVELVKGSLNTFLNAMTYPDKTLYPVASCNDTDFQNLMDIYLDAVFHPNIYVNEKVFRQEGWHYEMEAEEGPLTINGVVYNEMKGAFSSPESVLERVTMNSLFPDTGYGFESGGDPDVIPTLTYEDYLDFHRRYYHPSNSYLYLYGDMDMEEKLDYIDKNYLSAYEAEEIDSRVKTQAPFDAPKEISFSYPVTDEEEEDGAYLSLNMTAGSVLDEKEYVAFPILQYALLDAPGAPVKQALLDAGMGDDIFGGYDNGVLQPYFSVTAKGAEPERKEEFLSIVRSTLQKLAEEGIPRDLLLGGLNFTEFKYREADYGSFPKGLMYGLQCFDSWLYEGSPLMHLKYSHTFAWLRENLANGYFEGLLKQYLLDNPHTVFLTMVPEKGLMAKKEKALADQLQNMLDGWSAEKRREVIAETAALKAYQAEPSPREDLDKIPMLAREDIRKEILPLGYQVKKEEGITVLHTNLFTSGISYILASFDVSHLPEEELPYLGLIKSLIGLMDTEHYSYLDLNAQIYIHSGGITPGLGIYNRQQHPGYFVTAFEFAARVFEEKTGFAFDMIEEMTGHTSYADEKRLLENLNEVKSRMQIQLLTAGHKVAVLRASSYENPVSRFTDATSGVEFYEFLDDFLSHFDERKEEVIRHLEKLQKSIFTRSNLCLGMTGNDAAYEIFQKELPAFLEKLPEGEKRESAEQKGGSTPDTCCEEKTTGGFAGVGPDAYHTEKKQEGFKTSSGVQYVAICGNYKKAGLPFTGALHIAKKMLDYDYLWQNLRVMGGAYGCMSSFARSGQSYFVSYRDPNLRKTMEIYRGIPEYFASFDGDEKELTKFIIGTMSDLDTPLNPSARGNRAFSAWMAEVTDEMIQKERDQILQATPDDIRALAPYMKAVLEDDCRCTVGAESKVEEDRDLFEVVRTL